MPIRAGIKNVVGEVRIDSAGREDNLRDRWCTKREEYRYRRTEGLWRG